MLQLAAPLAQKPLLHLLCDRADDISPLHLRSVRSDSREALLLRPVPPLLTGSDSVYARLHVLMANCFLKLNAATAQRTLSLHRAPGFGKCLTLL